MRNKGVVLLLCAVVLAGCPKKQEALAPARPGSPPVNQPQDVSGKRANVIDRIGTAVIDRMVVGTLLAADGTVAETSAVVTAGEPVYLTLRLRDSPVGLRTGAIWFAENGKRIAAEQKDMNGTKVATFALTQKLAPGKYRVQGYWGGNVVGDANFEVVPKAKHSK